MANDYNITLRTAIISGRFAIPFPSPGSKENITNSFVRSAPLENLLILFICCFSCLIQYNSEAAKAPEEIAARNCNVIYSKDPVKNSYMSWKGMNSALLGAPWCSPLIYEQSPYHFLRKT